MQRQLDCLGGPRKDVNNAAAQLDWEERPLGFPDGSPDRLPKKVPRNPLNDGLWGLGSGKHMSCSLNSLKGSHIGD